MDNKGFNEPRLVTNSDNGTFYSELLNSLTSCNHFYFSVAFINYSGLQLLIDAFKALEDKNIKGEIIASTYLNFTDVKALRKLQTFENIETKIYISDQTKGFHTKGYIFEYDDYYKILIGSSNITQSALKANVEWNVRYISKSKHDDFIIRVINEFKQLWKHTTSLNTDFINH